MNKQWPFSKRTNILLGVLVVAVAAYFVYQLTFRLPQTDNRIVDIEKEEKADELTTDNILLDELNPYEADRQYEEYVQSIKEEESGKKKAPAKTYKPRVEPDVKHFGRRASYSYGKVRKNLSFKRVYGDTVNPPELDYNLNIEDKSLGELRFLRNEVFARKGYFFNNSIVRGYFNQFKWYQPNYWDGEFEVKLSPEENNYINRILTREKELLSGNTIEHNGHKLYNYENAVNLSQFKGIAPILTSQLKKQNYTINPSKDDQLWHIYDRNVYAGIPSFITTDLYLQLIHIHYKYLLKRLEKEQLMTTVKLLTASLFEQNLKVYENAEEVSELKAASKFNLVYLGIAANLLEEDLVDIPDELSDQFAEEFSKAFNCRGSSSDFIGDVIFDYSQLKPRGHYAGDPEFENYFKSVRWLLSFPFKLSNHQKLSSMVLLAQSIKENESNKALYNSFNIAVGAFAGDEDNLSLTNLITILEKDYNNYSSQELIAPSSLSAIANKLVAQDPEKMKAVGGTAALQNMLNQKKMYFMALRYNFDGAILQRLVKADQEKGYRPYPKGIDIFATMGDTEAESILFDIYKEAENWPEYADRLAKLKEEMQGNIDWNKSVYNKRMQLVLTLQYIDENLPGFMQTSAWQRKNLSTALAGWTHIKHEMVLYIKQPFMAQAGQGGGPPPPIVPSYVEPNTRFWSTSIEVLNHTKSLLSQNNIWSGNAEKFHKKMVDIAEILLTVSEKELNRQRVTDEEMLRLMWLPAEIEHLAFSIMGPYTNPKDKLPLVIDVYTRVGNDNMCLEEGIGFADEIYVLAEINGLVYLTRGSIFSIYEFKQPIKNRLTDSQWQENLRKGNIPRRPVWVQENVTPFNSIKSKPHYSFNSRPVTCKF